MSNVVDYASGPTAPTPAWMKWTGRVLSALPVLMMGAGGIYALLHPQMMEQGMSEQGWPAQLARPLAVVEVVCAIIYLIPQTAVLGAVLLTGYFGGAIASHLRAGQGLVAIVPFVFGVIVWLGLFLRDARVRALLPWRRV